MTRYIVYDVFTDVPFGGNQLAVFPDATGLAETHLQSIAAEFNFSEVTFVYPPDDPVNAAKVRIFTPTMEIPFAGHPTIGTALALYDEGQGETLTLELGIGPIPCRIASGSASFTTATPLLVYDQPDPALVAGALGLEQAAIRLDPHPPTQAGVGLPFVLVALQDNQSLEACQPNIDRFREGAARYPTGLDFAIYAYVREGDTINARMFAPLDNIPEDPATGSAAAALAGYLTQLSGQPQSLSIHQGVVMDRPSLIGARTTHDTDITVTITGDAVRVMEGRLLV